MVKPRKLPTPNLKVTGTWRFMGSSKWSYKSLIWVITILTLLLTPLITTHEPPSNSNHHELGSPATVCPEPSEWVPIKSIHVPGLSGFKGL